MKAATGGDSTSDTVACISIHAAREGGDGICPDCYRKMKISIHAAREGGDAAFSSGPAFSHTISIHAAREGGDDNLAQLCACGDISIHAAREGGDTIGVTF